MISELIATGVDPPAHPGGDRDRGDREHRQARSSSNAEGWAADSHSTTSASASRHFSHLKHLPVDYLNRGSFIRDRLEPGGPAPRAAIVGVARGVLHHCWFVGGDGEPSWYGVDFAQGYFIGRPMPLRASRTATPRRLIRPQSELEARATRRPGSRPQLFRSRAQFPS
jgi:hypothetical protein